MRTLKLLFAGLVWAGCPLPDDDFDRDGFSIAERDCDDLDPSRNPGAPEVPGDAIDQDCDGHDPQMRAVGEAHVCLLLEGGQVRCGGDNAYGQLEAPRHGAFVQIAAGDHHTCALAETGEVACWGDDRFGQASPPPGPFVGIGADQNWSLGEDAAGGAICWGLCRVSRAR
jgi:hypothetical protein